MHVEQVIFVVVIGLIAFALLIPGLWLFLEGYEEKKHVTPRNECGVLLAFMGAVLLYATIAIAGSPP